jgi:hypothetical protein
MRRHDGGTDRGKALEMRRQAPVAGTGQFPVFGRCGARCAVSQTAHRAAPGLRPGVQRPPARSWLTSGPTALLEREGLETQAKSAARRRSENAAVERHEGALFVRMRRLALRHPLTLRGGKRPVPAKAGRRGRTPRRHNNRGGEALAV